MLNAVSLADEIRSAMGFPNPVSNQLKGWAKALVDEITNNAIITNAINTINGSCPPGSALSNGTGTGGIISGLLGTRFATSVASNAGYSTVSSRLQSFCTQIVLHIQTFGTVTFLAGSITGTCTNTGGSPGPLVNGAGNNGMVIGLDGTVLANAIHVAAGYPGSTSTRLIQFCTAMTNHIKNNGNGFYTSGGVTGSCPAGGGALVSGTGSNGQIN